MNAELLDTKEIGTSKRPATKKQEKAPRKKISFMWLLKTYELVAVTAVATLVFIAVKQDSLYMQIIGGVTATVLAKMVLLNWYQGKSFFASK